MWDKTALIQLTCTAHWFVSFVPKLTNEFLVIFQHYSLELKMLFTEHDRHSRDGFKERKRKSFIQWKRQKMITGKFLSFLISAWHHTDPSLVLQTLCRWPGLETETLSRSINRKDRSVTDTNVGESKHVASETITSA